GALFHAADRAERHRNPEQLVQQSPRLAPTEMVGAGEQRYHGGQAGAKGRRGDLLRVISGPGPGTATLATHLVPPPLRQVRAMVANLELLIAACSCVA